MRKTDLLRDLQSVDTQLDRVKQALDQSRAELGDDSNLVPLREQVQVAERSLQSLQSLSRDLDREIEDRTARRKVDEKKLYGGTVKNPKELGSLAREVELEKEQISKLEDQALANMDALEEASATLEAARKVLSEREGVWSGRQAVLQDEVTSFSRQSEELTQRRAELAAQLDAPSLRNYESLRRTRGGLAVVAVEQRACQGCRISLTPNLVQRARSSPEPVLCQNCGRILYVPN